MKNTAIKALCAVCAGAATFCACRIVQTVNAPPEPPIVIDMAQTEPQQVLIRGGVLHFARPQKTRKEVEAITGEKHFDDTSKMPETDTVCSDEDISALAKMAWGEARGCGDDGIRAVMWCVMHRLDAGYADTVLGVVSAPGQFYGYSASHPVDEHIAALAQEVLGAHAAGEEPLLPEGYVYFTGDGEKNIFRNGAGERWTV